MIVPDLSPRDYAVLRQLVLGSLEEIPETLVELKLARVKREKKLGGMVGLRWIASRAGRLLVAEREEN